MGDSVKIEDLNYNDYKVLQMIIKDKKGTSKLTGRTKVEMMELTGLGRTKINKSVKYLLELGLIDLGIMKVRAKTYYITPKGAEVLRDMKEKTI